MAFQVLDTSALLAYLRDDAGAAVVQAAMEAAIRRASTLIVSEVSFAELIARVLRDEGDAAWQQVQHSLESLPITLVPSSRDVAEAAGQAMRDHSLSAPAAFALATAKAKKTELLSADPTHKRAGKDVKIVFLE